MTEPGNLVQPLLWLDLSAFCREEQSRVESSRVETRLMRTVSIALGELGSVFTRAEHEARDKACDSTVRYNTDDLYPTGSFSDLAGLIHNNY
jgi:hypothetical protein